MPVPLPRQIKRRVRSALQPARVDPVFEGWGKDHVSETRNPECPSDKYHVFRTMSPELEIEPVRLPLENERDHGMVLDKIGSWV
jgi:hypothetical protein